VTSTQRAEAAIRLLLSATSRARMRTEVEKRVWLQRVWGLALAKLECLAPANHGPAKFTRQGPYAASLLDAKKSAAMARWWDVPHNDREEHLDRPPLCCNINACYSTASPIVAVDLISGANTGVNYPSCLAGILCSRCVWSPCTSALQLCGEELCPKIDGQTITPDCTASTTPPRCGKVSDLAYVHIGIALDCRSDQTS
jgi:hypothetical protein